MKTTYVLGAGASKDAGYPLARSMGNELFNWMDEHKAVGIYDFREAARTIKKLFGSDDDIEALLTKLEELTEQPALAADLRNTLIEALRQWFIEIRQGSATSYEQFARRIVQGGDSIISFNYDVALDRQLKLAGLWELGDGYGFQVEDFEVGSRVKFLKLHGSINWFASQFGGVISGPAAVPWGGVMGRRPVFYDSELRFLGYDNALDRALQRRGTTGHFPLILPTRCKKFYFETSLGRQWEDFWDHLWGLAANVLDQSQRIVICGYSLLAVDKRACELLLTHKTTPRLFEVCCGGDSENIVERLRSAGHDAHVTDEQYFGDWVRQQIDNRQA